MRFTQCLCMTCMLFSVSAANAVGSKENADIAAKSTAAISMLNDFSNAFAMAKICNYRTDAVLQYYTSEYRRVLRHEAPGKMEADDINIQVGVLSVSVQMFAKQFENKKLTAKQCADVRVVIDQKIPRGYD